MEREPGVRAPVTDQPPGRAPLVAHAPPAAPAAPAAGRRSAAPLFAAWAVYWLALLAWQLWPLARGWWRIRQAGGKGTLNVAYSGDFYAAALWIAGPPLLLALLWLFLTARRRGPARRSAPPPP